MTYRLYAQDGVTPVAIPQPNVATWRAIERGTNADGSTRTARKVGVDWEFRAPMLAADFQKFTAHRGAGGVVIFETWRKPIGNAAAGFVKVRGILAEPSGVERDGQYRGVVLKFTQVEEYAG